MGEKLTRADRQILEALASGVTVKPSIDYYNYASPVTGKQFLGVPSRIYYACKRRGWIADEGITDKGREALSHKGK